MLQQTRPFRPETAHILPTDRKELVREIEYLRAENERLAALIQMVPTPLDWRLSTYEERLFLEILHARGVLTKAMALTAIYRGSPDEPDGRILDVFMCKLRQKTRPFGVVIETIWGRGWRLVDREQWLERLRGEVQ